MITTILWDVDGTLLDFAAAEATAVRRLFEEYHLGICTDEMLARYSAINKQWWQRLERGECTKPEILVGRFREFLEGEGLDGSLAPDINGKYQHYLGDTIVYRDDSYHIVQSLQGKIKQYVVSNGTVIAQTKKLRLSGLGELMDGIFLSEQLGVEKPNPGFFQQVFAAIGAEDPKQIMIVGDSCTSDILGGINANIITCWYNPNKEPPINGLRADYEIADLHEVFSLLGSE